MFRGHPFRGRSDAVPPTPRASFSCTVFLLRMRTGRNGKKWLDFSTAKPAVPSHTSLHGNTCFGKVGETEARSEVEKVQWDGSSLKVPYRKWGEKLWLVNRMNISLWVGWTWWVCCWNSVCYETSLGFMHWNIVNLCHFQLVLNVFTLCSPSVSIT